MTTSHTAAEPLLDEELELVEDDDDEELELELDEELELVVEEELELDDVEPVSPVSSPHAPSSAAIPSKQPLKPNRR